MSTPVSISEVFFAIDIETAGIDKPIFAIGCCLFKRNILDFSQSIKDTDIIEILETRCYSYKPKRPSASIDTDGLETINYNDFSMNTWDSFWSKYTDVLDTIDTQANCSSEQQMLAEFYDYWMLITQGYHNMRIVSDNVAFDIGYIDHRMAVLGDKLNNSRDCKSVDRRPLNHQLRKKKWYYICPIDTNTLECVIKMSANGKECLETLIDSCPYNNSHDPTEDAKRVAWIFSRITQYLSG
jgi:hypothetical protein